MPHCELVATNFQGGVCRHDKGWAGVRQQDIIEMAVKNRIGGVWERYRYVSTLKRDRVGRFDKCFCGCSALNCPSPRLNRLTDTRFEAPRRE